MPRFGKTESEKQNLKRERNMLKSNIKISEKNLKKVAAESTDLIFEDDVEKVKNLASKINFPNKNWEKMDPLEYEKNKKNVTLKALKVFSQPAQLGTAGVVELARVCESFPNGQGCLKNTIKAQSTIQECFTRCLIDMAEKGTDPTKYMNPYVMLLGAIALPIGATFASNAYAKKKVPESQKQEKSKEE